ncbi:MAG: sugar phosphate isomerase/epimerase family protein [Chitinophagales bacterium]
MGKQNFEVKNEKIRDAFFDLKKNRPEKLRQRLNLSWSNWGFGIEPLRESVERLKKYGVNFIELHGNHYGPDLGYRVNDVKKILDEYQVKVSGICGMFSAENDLSSNRAAHRQAAVDYIKREIEFAVNVGGSYMLVVPGAVGRNSAYDDAEFERSVETLGLVAGLFSENNIKAAIEPIRSAEVSLVHTVADAKRYMEAVNHPGVKHINGDIYHMQSEESHIGEALLDAGVQLVNLHLADSNRCAIGMGAMDLDTIIMALYLLEFNREGRYVTPEPLGPGGDPYPAMFGKTDKGVLNQLVEQTARYFREREDTLLS